MGHRRAGCGGIHRRSMFSSRETASRTSATTSVSVVGCAIRTQVKLASDAIWSGPTDPTTARNASYPQLEQ